MIRPGPRLVRGVGALAVVCLGLALWPLAAAWLALPAPAAATLPGLALAVGLGTLAALAGAEARRLSRVALELERPATTALSLGETETLHWNLSAGHHGARAGLEVTLRQRWPGLVEPAISRASGRLEVGRALPLSLPVRAVSRGRETLEPAWLTLSERGWVERYLPLPEAGPAELAVLPNLRAVGRLHGQLDRLFLRGLGSRVSPRLGKGREFERLREYVHGDDIRDMAWKASARHGQWILREFRLDRSQDLLFCLDRGHRMAARLGGLTRLDQAVNAAVLLASIANRFEDRSGVLAFADGLTAADQGLPQGRGAAHLRTLTSFTAALAPEYRHSDYLALAAHLRRRLKSRTLIVIWTALPELGDEGELVRATGLLVPQHLPLFVVFTDPDLEAAARTRPADLAELSRTLVAGDLYWTRKRTLAELRRRGALVVETRPGDAGIASVNAYLDVKRRQLL